MDKKDKEILLRILMEERYLDGGLSHIHLQLLKDGGIGCGIRTVDRSIPLSLKDDVGNAPLGKSLVNQSLAWTFMDHALARIFDFVNHSLDHSLPIVTIWNRSSARKEINLA
jgi:hypothetical protein